MRSLYALETQAFESVRALFGDLLNYNILIPAVLEGTSPGRVYVDEVHNPQSTFLWSVEGYFLAGRPDNAAFNAALKDLILATVFAGDTLRPGDTELFVDCFPGEWVAQLPAIFPRPPLVNPRQHYLCTALAYDWRAHVPAGFSVHRIDQALLDRPGLDLPDHITGWMQANWGSIPAFLARGFGFATLHGDRVVSWSLADGASGDRCEIGIHTQPDYRRRGLATITAAAAVDHALSHGYNAVGWHCNFDNYGSSATARRVGFVLEREYVHHYCMASEWEHLAETGNMYYRQGDDVRAAHWLDQSAALSDSPAVIPYYAACAYARTGRHDDALRCLRLAVDRGFDRVEAVANYEPFQPLHSAAGWQAVLNQMKAERQTDVVHE
jgi:RimJ/RimL family protein N-acetyltransferase